MKLAFLLAALLAPPAYAQAEFSTDGVAECDDSTRADTIAEPWDKHSATFAEGAIRVAVLDYVEPAAAAFKLLILSPPHDELGIRQCRVVSRVGDQGFGNIHFEGLKAAYDPQIGLTLTMPVGTYDPETSDSKMSEISVHINQATGDITVKGNQ